jgi:hypothetical protein
MERRQNAPLDSRRGCYRFEQSSETVTVVATTTGMTGSRPDPSTRIQWRAPDPVELDVEALGFELADGCCGNRGACRNCGRRRLLAKYE